MDIDYLAARFWWEVMMTVGVVANSLYQLSANKDRATKKSILEMEKDFAKQKELFVNEVHELSERITVVEGKLEAAPDDESIANLHIRLDATNREMGELIGMLDATKHLLNTLHEFMLNSGRTR